MQLMPEAPKLWIATNALVTILCNKEFSSTTETTAKDCLVQGRVIASLQDLLNHLEMPEGST